MAGVRENMSNEAPSGFIAATVRRPVAVVMVAISVMVFGYVSYDRLALHLMPDIRYPSLTVRVEMPDAAPAEVENALMIHEGIADVAVVGVPDDRWGEVGKAFVVPVPDVGPSAEEILSFVRERLAGFKCPTTVEFVETIPRNPSGKILKRELRDPYWEGRDRQV